MGQPLNRADPEASDRNWTATVWEMIAQVGFLDKVPPDGLHEYVLGHVFVTVTNENQEGFEGFRCDGYRLILAEEDLLIGVDTKGPELVEDFRF